MKRIYLDNAATSWPKPDIVYTAIDRYLRENGAPAGRTTSAQASSVQTTISGARQGVARLIGSTDANEIVFTTSGTTALNLGIHGLLRPGDHAICTQADHNSILRPLRFLEEHGQVNVTRVTCNPVGLVDPNDIRRALRPKTRLVAMLHASNVTGVIEPVAEIGRLVREHGARFLLDAAQSLGHLPISVDAMNVDLLAAPGHKGLLGPLGTGVLYIRSGLQDEIESLFQGGTGTQSELDQQPNCLPDKYEAGNQNVPGLVGLAAGLGWLEQQGVTTIRDREQSLAERLRSGFRKIRGVTIFDGSSLAAADVERAAERPSEFAAVVSIQIDGFDPQEAAAILESTFGIQTRAGLHCAAQLHAAMGTLHKGGALRFSPGAFTWEDGVDAAIAAVGQLATAI
ncbi:MAG TPA: aminotransferase class V-fold PLP-dependent enzyme [Pirellulales bacterium]